MKKKEWSVWSKLRPKLREVYRFSPNRRFAIKAAEAEKGWFVCPLCAVRFPIQMAEVDHDPQLGSFTSYEELADWVKRLFEGSVRVICKICHKKVTAQQRKKK